MKTGKITSVLIFLLAGCAPAVNFRTTDNARQPAVLEQPAVTQEHAIASQPDVTAGQSIPASTQEQAAAQNIAAALAMPLENAAQRVTKKPFGIKASPQNSPVQPEKFSGYHTGTDFEIFPDELNKDVAVSAICGGKILQKRTARGYGGVIVQSCTIQDHPVTVVYGHMKLTAVSQKVGDALAAGESFALLGDAYSAQTGGERKHLHLGIKEGTAVNLLGYVQNQSELSGWIDFGQFLK